MTQEVAILRLTTDDGLMGLGEVAGPVLPRDLEAAVEWLSRATAGHRPGDGGRHRRRASSAGRSIQHCSTSLVVLKADAWPICWVVARQRSRQRPDDRRSRVCRCRRRDRAGARGRRVPDHQDQTRGRHGRGSRRQRIARHPGRGGPGCGAAARPQWRPLRTRCGRLADVARPAGPGVRGAAHRAVAGCGCDGARAGRDPDAPGRGRVGHRRRSGACAAGGGRRGCAGHQAIPRRGTARLRPDGTRGRDGGCGRDDLDAVRLGHRAGRCAACRSDHPGGSGARPGHSDAARVGPHRWRPAHRRRADAAADTAWTRRDARRIGDDDGHGHGGSAAAARSSRS